MVCGLGFWALCAWTLAVDSLGVWSFTTLWGFEGFLGPGRGALKKV